MKELALRAGGRYVVVSSTAAPTRHAIVNKHGVIHAFLWPFTLEGEADDGYVPIGNPKIAEATKMTYELSTELILVGVHPDGRPPKVCWVLDEDLKVGVDRSGRLDFFVPAYSLKEAPEQL